MKIFCQSSFWDHHIVHRISFLKFYNLPVIRTIFSIHITKLFWHLSVYSIWSNIYYFKISIKSLGVRYLCLYSVYSYFYCRFVSLLSSYLSKSIVSSKWEYILLLTLDIPTDELSKIDLLLIFFELFRWLVKMRCLDFFWSSIGLSFYLAIRGIK